MAEILGFPLDVTQYTAAALGAWHGARTRGVFCDDNSFEVKPGGGMNVLLGPGLGNLKMEEYWGVHAHTEEAIPFTIATAHSTLPRYDAMCVRINKNMNIVEAVIKTGTPATKPVIPAIEHDTLNYDEIYPAAIYVKAGAKQITAGDIQDLRGLEPWCGFVRDNVERIPTQMLYDQWLSWFNSLRDDAEGRYQLFSMLLGEYEATAEGKQKEFIEKLQQLEAIYTERHNAWFSNLKESFEAEVYDWFERLQDTLGENAAVELFNMIDRHIKQTFFKNEVHGARAPDGQLQIWDGLGWINAGGTGEAGLSFGYLDSLDLTLGEWDAYDYTLGEFEQLRERYQSSQGWAALNARSMSVEQLNSAASAWADSDLSGTGVSTGPSQRTEHLGLADWQLQDIPQMADFNADNALIDAAVKATDGKVAALADNLAIHSHDAGDVGAAPSNHSHTAEDVGALAKDAKAADSSKLEGKEAAAFALAGHSHTAADIGALGKDSQAADSAKLGGKAADAYATKEDVENAGGGDMLRSVYDKDGDGKVDAAATADKVPWNCVSDKPSTFTPAAHSHSEYATSGHTHTAAAIGAAATGHTHSNYATTTTVEALTARVAALEKLLTNCPDDAWFIGK